MNLGVKEGSKGDYFIVEEGNKYFLNLLKKGIARNIYMGFFGLAGRHVGS